MLNGTERAAHDHRVKILFHADYLWLGGLEKKVGRLVLGLDRTRFEPIVSWHRKWGGVGDELVNHGISVVHIAPAHDDDSAIEQIRDIAPTIFHSFSCRLTSADVLNARAAGVPWVMTNRGSIAPQDSPVQDWETERNRRTDRIVGCSRAVSEACVAREGVAAEQVLTIHNGVNFPVSIPARDKPFRIGYAATYRTLKLHEVLLRALRGITNQHPEVRLMCCGEQYDGTRDRLAQLVIELGLEGRVHLLNATTDIDSFYRHVDIYVHPSSVEGFSNAILEAMAQALPVVASRVGGNPEAVEDGVTGFLVAAGDARELEQALSVLLGDPSLCRRFGEAGLDRVRGNFSIPKMAGAYQDVYRNLIASHSRTDV